ncbi:MAG: DUF4011 domain-containing protein [Tannerellaceae bacterium]|nr:DUF4011 domain-containing protein [Tannerellaceae bacterium]
MIERHAFAGGWLIEETFPDILIDDVSALTKRAADGINEILLLETTCMNKSNGSNFDRAVQIANSHLQDINRFECALDIRRIRYSGIKPLPHRVQEEGKWVIKYDDVVLNNESEFTLQELKLTDLSIMDQEETLTKQVLWERKLLDLSLRNSLLNLRITKNTLQFLSPDPGYFEDALADGKEFRVFPFFQDWENPEYNRELKHLGDMNEQRIALIKKELSSNRLRSYLSENELKNALQHLYRSSRLSLEENGANTLYLALGFLKWYETSSSVKPRYAPLLLLPVEIVRKASAGGYVIRSREEETLMNITLLEMLRQNYGIVVPGLDPLPVDESGVNVNLIYSIIRTSIKEQPRWDVDEQAVLGIFSFNKFIMWNDIHHNADKLSRNDLVASLMNGKLEWEAKEITTDASVLDKELSPADILLPIGADSSQLEAIHEAVQGNSFILHGPPGTGKSQTITNIIVNALYHGKRVLFVAEKMAALSVVQARLKSLGLDPFCLELHSNKSKKSTVMEQLKLSSEVIRYKSPEQFAQEAEKLHELRIELNTYIDALHRVYPFGHSLYDSITGYLSSTVLNEIDFPVSLLDELTSEKYEKWESAVEGMMNVGQAFGHPAKNPLAGIQIESYSNAVKEEGMEVLRTLIHTLTDLKEKQYDFTSVIGTATAPNRKQLEQVNSMITILLRIPELTSSLLTQLALHELLEEYKEVVVHGRNRDQLKKELCQTFSEEIVKAPVRSWLTEWNHYATKWFLPRCFGQKRIQKEIKNIPISNGWKPN